MQLCRLSKVAALRGVHQFDEQLGGDLGKSTYGAVGTGEKGGQDQVFPARQHREVRPHALGLPQRTYSMEVLGNDIFQPAHVRTFGSYSTYQRGREVYTGQHPEVVDHDRYVYRLGHSREVPEEGLLSHLPVEEGKTTGTASAPALSAWRASSSVSFVPAATPTTSGTRPLTILTTSSAKRLRSSPVLPKGEMPSTPASIKRSTTASVASRSAST